jgi:hypothetical protein
MGEETGAERDLCSFGMDPGAGFDCVLGEPPVLSPAFEEMVNMFPQFVQRTFIPDFLILSSGME